MCNRLDVAPAFSVESIGLGAACGLSRDAYAAISEVLLARRDEHILRASDVLKEVLPGMTDLNLDQIIAANSDALTQCAHLLGRLRKLRAAGAK